MKLVPLALKSALAHKICNVPFVLARLSWLSVSRLLVVVSDWPGVTSGIGSVGWIATTRRTFDYAA